MMMQLGGSTTVTTSATTAATTTAAAAPTSDAAVAAAAVGPLEGPEEIGDRGFGGNRWPRQETLGLLKIRSDMDVAFRDASVKGPLWEEVSRKMAELGYSRSAKKCKEKFENVYKYHKRTKEGRTGKSEGKTYRFFDQLEALENQSSSAHHQPYQPPQPPPPLPPRPQNNNTTTMFSAPPPPPPVATTAVTSSSDNPPPPQVTTVTSTMPLPNITVPSFPPFNPPVSSANPINISSFPSVSGDFLSDSTPSSSSTSSDVEIGGTRKKRKRKWKEFFERLMKQVVDKQEELQRRFLEAVEKREHERMVREDAWRMQEMARINREREILAQERSMAAAKDAAVMAFLQKLSENQNPGQSIQPPQPPQQPPRPPPPQSAAPPPSQPQPAVTTLDPTKTDNGDQNFTPTSSSRWPKVEIEALIKLRTNLDSKYQENGPKGPLWEEISAGMRRLGYNRSAKRCKEKWENINKYFKKVKESNKKRPEDSKTCPYFHQLDALYREKNKFNFVEHNMASSSSSGQIKPENTVPLMVQPEQQWPPPPQQSSQPSEHHRPDLQMEDIEGENFDQNPDEGDEDDRDGDEDEDEDEDDEGGEFEIVPNNNNKGVSLGTSG